MSRRDLPAKLKMKSILEVGVHCGEYLSAWHGAGYECTGVDMWEPTGSYQENRDGDYAAAQAACPRANLIKAPDNIIETFTPGMFDVIYLDAAHDHESVVRNIRQALRLAPSVIAGHDYVVNGWHTANNPYEAKQSRDDATGHIHEFGVMSAVDFLLGDKNIMVIGEEADSGWSSWVCFLK